MSRYSTIWSIVVSIILISLAISATTKDSLDDVPNNQNEAVVAVSPPKSSSDVANSNSNENNGIREVITDDAEHYHESGLSAAMVDALKKLEDSTRSGAAMETVQKTIDFSEMGGISEERLAEVREVFDWLDDQMLELDESRQVERVLKRVKNYLFYDTNGKNSNQNNANNENNEINENDENNVEIKNKNDEMIYNSSYLMSDLELLEDYLHQIDNAKNFMNLNGIETLLAVINQFTNDNGKFEVSGESERIEIIENTLSLLAVLSNNNEDIINYINSMPLTKQFPVMTNNNNDENRREMVLNHPILTVLDLLQREITSNWQISSQIEGKYYVSKLIYALSAMTRQNENGLKMMATYEVSDVLYQLFDSLLSLNGNQNNDNSDNNSNINKDILLLKLFRLIDDIISLNEMNSNILNLSKLNHFCEIMKHGLTMTSNNDGNNNNFFDYSEHRQSALNFFQNIVSIPSKQHLLQYCKENEIDFESINNDLNQMVDYIDSQLEMAVIQNEYDNDSQLVQTTYDEYDTEMMNQQKLFTQDLIRKASQNVEIPKIEL